MREIQDLTLNISRGLERLERRLSERSERFQQEFERIDKPEKSFGIRATAMPVGNEIRFDRVFRHRQIIENLSEQWRPALQKKDGTRIYDEAQDTEPIHWRPILRGVRAERFSEDTYPHKLFEQIYREIHCDGLIESGHLSLTAFFRFILLPSVEGKVDLSKRRAPKRVDRFRHLDCGMFTHFFNELFGKYFAGGINGSLNFTT